MAILNGYATLTQCRDDNRIESTDVKDDSVIETLIENVSRYIDTQTRRWFYPQIQTRSFDVPDDDRLHLDADLLYLTTLTNGDDVAIAPADFTTQPKNQTPYWAIDLKGASSVFWTFDSNANSEVCIDVLGIWGYHERYSEAWRSGSTLSAAITTAAATSIALTSGVPFQIGQIIKIDSEFMLITNIDLNTATVERGHNGSTAITHLISMPVYIWRWDGSINQACRMIVNNVYHNRFGGNPMGQVTVTSAGVVISPADVPGLAKTIIEGKTRL